MLPTLQGEGSAYAEQAQVAAGNGVEPAAEQPAEPAADLPPPPTLGAAKPPPGALPPPPSVWAPPGEPQLRGGCIMPVHMLLCAPGHA